MAAMVRVVLARQRSQPGSVLSAIAVAGIALLLSLRTVLVAPQPGEAPLGGAWTGGRSQEPLSLAVGAGVLALAALALLALGRRRLGVAWAVSAAVLSAGSAAGSWVDLAGDALTYDELFQHRPAQGAVGVFGRLCVAGGLGGAVVAAAALVGRPGPPRRSLVLVGAAATGVLLLGVALDPGSVDPNFNDAFGPRNPLAPWWSFQLAAVLLRLAGALGVGAVAIAGLLPLGRSLGRSRTLQMLGAVPAFAGAAALAAGVHWLTVVVVVIPLALLGVEVFHGEAINPTRGSAADLGPATGSIERLVGSGLGFGRLIALGWAVVLAVAGAGGTPDVAGHAPVPWALLLAAGVVTVGQVVQPAALHSRRSRRWVAAEVAVGLALAALGPSGADRNAGAGAVPPPGWPWPLVGVVATGVVFGPVAGAGWGAVLGLARLVVELSTSRTVAQIEVLNLVSTAGLYALGGALAGLVFTRLRRAEAEVAAARAREGVARALHDGVMQSLAVIRRRADPEVARIAADADRELRAYLARGEDAPIGLAQVLRDTVDMAASVHGAEAALALDPDLPELSPERLVVVRGIVSEALANAAKHAAANHITVYAGPDLADKRLMVSVRDDGVGFDIEQAAADRGLARSIRGRASEAGIRVEVHSEPGRGTEVCFWP